MTSRKCGRARVVSVSVLEACLGEMYWYIVGHGGRERGVETATRRGRNHVK
jgi:hypothetical protein